MLRAVCCVLNAVGLFLFLICLSLLSLSVLSLLPLSFLSPTSRPYLLPLLLGSRPIRILGVKHYGESLPNEIMLDVELEFFQGDDSQIQFEVGLVGVPAPLVIELKELMIRAVLRIHLSPLLSTLPILGACSLSFPNRPDLDFRLQALQVQQQ